MPGPSASETLAAETRAAIERGEDPLGDNDDLPSDETDVEDEGDANTPTTAAAAAAADEGAAAAGAADSGAGTGEHSTAAEGQIDPADLAKVAGDDDADPEADPVTYQTSGKDFKAELEKVETDMQAVEAKWEAGDLTDAEKRDQMAALRKTERALIQAEASDATLLQMNQQNVANQQLAVLRNLSSASKAAGQLDYSDAKVSNAFDAMLTAVGADPENAGKSFKALAMIAHNALCAARGIEAKPAPEAKSGERKSPPVPMTLRGIPAAATSNTGGDKLDALGKLSGQRYMDAFASLSAVEKARALGE